MNQEKQTALDSLTATYTDSEGEGEADSDDEIKKRDPSHSVESSSGSSGHPANFSPRDPMDIDDQYGSRVKLQSKLVSYTSENHEDGALSDSDESRSSDFEMQDESNESKAASSPGNPPLSPISFHRSLMNLKRNEIRLPPEPQGRCSKAVQEKISELYKKKKEGKNMIAFIQQKKNFRNPSIYEKLVAYCNIDERGTNYPPETYDPHCWGPESFYEELAKRQKEEMDRREKEKKERTKVEFISGTAKKQPIAPEPSIDPNKRKSKWDVGISQVTATLKPATLITPTVLPVATGTKPTVISAFGTISKKPKQ